MTASQVLNVAIVGCGEVAQCVHLPNLKLDHERYTVTALCDISQQSLQLCSDRFGVKACFTSVTDMLASPTPIDLVFILTADEYHAEHVIACADAGKHIMLEKPMCQTLAEADAIEAARVRNNVVVFVGYMRRYAPALAKLKEAIRGKQIRYVRVRDIIGNNRYFTSQSGTHLRYFRDFPPTAASDLAARRAANLATNKAGSDPRDAHNLSLLGSLGSHDLSAMREVLGMPKRCIAATRSHEPGDETKSWWWTALFDYGSFKANFEMAIDEVAVFDAHIEVYTNDSRVKIQYDTPYVKGLPITLTIQQQSPADPSQFETTTYRPTYVDAYTLELDEVYAAVAQGGAYKTTPGDAKNDLLLRDMIMGALVD